MLLISDTGELLVGRQFVPMTREAVLGLSSVFSISAKSLEGNTVTIGSTQVLFQALGHLWLVLALQNGANIAEGLTALALISDVLQRQSVLPSCTIASAHEHVLDIVAAIDECLPGGIPEGTADSVITRLAMKSATELQEQKEKANKERKARAEARQRAREIDAAEAEAAMLNGRSPPPGYTGGLSLGEIKDTIVDTTTAAVNKAMDIARTFVGGK